MPLDPDTGDYGRIPLDVTELAGVPSREVLRRMGTAWPAWLALDAWGKITAVSRLFPGMAYVDRPFNPIARVIMYLDKYAAQSQDAFLAPAGQVPVAQTTTEVAALRAQVEHLRSQAQHLRSQAQHLRASNRWFCVTATGLLVAAVALVLDRDRG